MEIKELKESRETDLRNVREQIATGRQGLTDMLNLEQRLMGAISQLDEMEESSVKKEKAKKI